MNNDLLIYILIISLSAGLSLFLSLFASFKLRRAPGAKHYVIVTILSSLFSIFYCFELTSTTLKEITYWLSLEYLVMPFIPAFVFLMCTEYIGKKLSLRNYYLLFAIPCLTVLMQTTNGLHHLYYTSVQLRVDTPFPIIDLTYGPFFYLHSLYLVLCLTASIITLVLQWKNNSRIFQFQLLTMIAGLLTPIIANYFYLNDLSPYGIDFGPVSMSLSFVFHFIALVSFKMFHVTPIFRDTIFERMKEGVLVLNREGMVLDFNQAMKVVIPSLKSSIIGYSLENTLSENKHLMELLIKKKDCEYHCVIENRKTYYQVHFSEVKDKHNKIIGHILTFIDMTEKIEMQEKLKKLASIDGLTKVYNRTYFTKEYKELLKFTENNGGNLSLIMFDIDHFKKINDQYGHLTGDMVLTHVAAIAKASIRKDDIIVRYGGEEFIILLPNTKIEEAIILSDTIRQKVLEIFLLKNNKKIQTTLSLGISSHYVHPSCLGDTIHELIREADEALYTAKQKGRNNSQPYTKEYSMQ
ncbi:histidine kinase N-terminal 7TM domain-containing protein [Bacillus sp. B1-b2]|uniref:histidine kinase N-terminal 7TM domain-containing diguanylate cyclase n=1 Tax=Bacillus sp. B1-b2 TaxID=2653201 RepID=UPI00126275E7|nr:histidine kinase N-terminal 7TM domain-containing protein [Bacillus sp. B1-b2]KAB7673208.1 diguanylate cyclase [Bacillus sp. B1-b2]